MLLLSVFDSLLMDCKIMAWLMIIITGKCAGVGVGQYTVILYILGWRYI